MNSLSVIGSPTGRRDVSDAVLDLFAPPRIEADRRDDGAVLLRSTEELGAFAPSMAHLFRAHADEHPGPSHDSATPTAGRC
jgi:hypothetical protein